MTSASKGDEAGGTATPGKGRGPAEPEGQVRRLFYVLILTLRRVSLADREILGEQSPELMSLGGRGLFQVRLGDEAPVRAGDRQP